MAWRLIAPQIVEKYPIAGSLVYSKKRELTVFGDDVELFTAEEGGLTEGGDEYNSIPWGTKYIWQGGHVNTTSDAAIKDLWIANGFSVEVI